jgi:hypothetical protein
MGATLNPFASPEARKSIEELDWPQRRLSQYRAECTGSSWVQIGQLPWLLAAAFGGGWPPSAALGRAWPLPICGARPPSAELGSYLQGSAAIGGASGVAAICGARPTSLGFNYWVTVPKPGFPQAYCGKTVMVVPRAGRGRSQSARLGAGSVI